jgi:hypothetical protein
MSEGFMMALGVIAILGASVSMGWAIAQQTRNTASTLLYKVIPFLSGLSSVAFICLTLWGPA